MITLIAERHLVRVQFLQSGGIVGVTRGCELDSSALAPAEARELELLVNMSGLAPAGRFLSPEARDLRVYEITVDRAGKNIAVTYDDETLPAVARPLVGFLRSRSTPRPAE